MRWKSQGFIAVRDRSSNVPGRRHDEYRDLAFCGRVCHLGLENRMIEAQILVGDCLAVLPTLPAGCVQTCVCSPPYWGLRDYQTATWEGGDPGCDHKRFNAYPTGLVGTDDAQRNGKFFKDVCQKCGARRIDSQLGLESTLADYIAKMVAVFREVWRVLKPDATCWINLGDSFADKQLQGIPWRVAFALQSDGWTLRSDIIWNKKNPMPESVLDRPTKSHEFIFLLSKAERYYYDSDAIKEKSDGWNGSSFTSGWDRSTRAFLGTGPRHETEFRNKRDVWTVATQPFSQAHFATFPEDLIKPCILAGTRLGDTVLDPFAGSGTSLKVALELGRSAIGIELNPAYAQLARDRCNVTPGFL
jgi:DNA modification methylase